MFPLLTTITPSDKSLFYKTLSRWRPDSKNYEDSWGYIIQATRYDGHKWYDPTTESLIFFGRKSLTDQTLIIPNFFAEIADLKKVLHATQSDLSSHKVILKNISNKNIKKFNDQGFRLYRDDEQWDSLARFDDQTYPQLLIDLKKILLKKGQKYRQLRRFLRKSEHATIREYNKLDKNAVLNIFREKDSYLAKPNQQMYYQSHAMYPDADLYKFVIIDEQINEIIGFTAFSSITSKTAASVASQFKPDSGAISIWGAYQTSMQAYQKGFMQINLGGSETKGPYNFLREKFNPIEEIKKTHLVFEI